MKLNRRLRPLLLAVTTALLFGITGLTRWTVLGADLTTTTRGVVSETTSVTANHRGDQAPPVSPGNHDTRGENIAATTQVTLPKVLLIIMAVLLVAKIGGDLLERLGQPAVLGELIFGILLGNLSLFHLHGLNTFVQNFVHDPQAGMFITLLSEIGVVLLLFEVGLQSTLHEMAAVGFSSFLVAIVGVVAPMVLGFGVGRYFLPHEPWVVALFLGSVLAATSVGITARVISDLRKMELRESRIILGAAVIDDILGLVVLAVVQGIVASVNSGKRLEVASMVWIVSKAGLFFVLAVGVGVLLSKRLYRFATALQVHGVLLTLTLSWCFLIAFLGTLVGLAPIVGAFAAGLVLEETTFKDWRGRDNDIEDLLRPITTFLVPIFFVHTGMNVQLEVFTKSEILGFAAALTVVAIIGKQVCAFGPIEKGLNRLAIGIGMIPRGEVGLIVANIGRGLKTAEGKPLVSQDAFSATIIMVVVTTMVTPPLLKWALERGARTTTSIAAPGES